MPRATASPCDCGCGQSSPEVTRLRLVKCDTCGFSYRTTRTWLEAMGELPRCPCCTDTMRVPCLNDMFTMSVQVAEASDEYADACRLADNRAARIAGKGRGRKVPKHVLCSQCHEGTLPGSLNGQCKACGFNHDGRGGGYQGAVPRSSNYMPF